MLLGGGGDDSDWSVDMTLQAFNNDAQFKQQLVDAAIEHRKSDDFIAGTYGKKNGRFRGCSVGCSLYDVQRLRGVAVEDYGDHALLAKTLGVPEWICRLQDSIFEGLPDDQRSQWTERLYTAIPVGVDLEPVRHRLAIRRLTRLADAQSKALESATDEHGLADVIKQVIATLDQVIACHRAEAGEIDCVADWSAAQSAAQSVAESAWSAWPAAWPAQSAVQSAAWSAQSAVQSAAWSAWSAVQSAAWSAARSAAESARSARSAWQKEADDLIELLAEAGEGGGQ